MVMCVHAARRFALSSLHSVCIDSDWLVIGCLVRVSRWLLPLVTPSKAVEIAFLASLYDDLAPELDLLLAYGIRMDVLGVILHALSQLPAFLNAEHLPLRDALPVELLQVPPLRHVDQADFLREWKELQRQLANSRILRKGVRQ